TLTAAAVSAARSLFILILLPREIGVRARFENRGQSPFFLCDASPQIRPGAPGPGGPKSGPESGSDPNFPNRGLTPISLCDSSTQIRPRAPGLGLTEIGVSPKSGSDPNF